MLQTLILGTPPKHVNFLVDCSHLLLIASLPTDSLQIDTASAITWLGGKSAYSITGTSQEVIGSQIVEAYDVGTFVGQEC